jgi:hypothetical protein
LIKNAKINAGVTYLLNQAPFLVLKLFAKSCPSDGDRRQEIAARMRQGKLELPLDVP